MVLRFMAVAVALVCLAGEAAFAQKAKEIKAVVQEVDVMVGTITVVAGMGQVKTFNLATPDLPVTDFADRPVKLKEVQPDQRVLLTMATNGDVAAIRVAPPTLFGILARVEVGERRLVLKINMEDRVVPLGRDVKIVASTGPIELKELKVGQGILIAYSAEKMEIVEIKVGKIAQPTVRYTKGSGTLIEIDAEKRTLDVLGNSSPTGDQFPLRQYKVTQDATCSILYQGKAVGPFPLEEVVRGVKASYWRDPATKKIVHLQIDMPILAQRRLKAFDAGEKRLVIENADGDRTLVLAAGARVLVPTGMGRLEDLKPGMIVHCGLRPDRKTVEVVQVLPK